MKIMEFDIWKMVSKYGYQGVLAAVLELVSRVKRGGVGEHPYAQLEK